MTTCSGPVLETQYFCDFPGVVRTFRVGGGPLLWIRACISPLIPQCHTTKNPDCSMRKTKTQTSLCIQLAPVLFARYLNLLQARFQYSSKLYTFKHAQTGFRLTYTYLHSLKTNFSLIFVTFMHATMSLYVIFSDEDS